jgi:hypothetical protein
MSKATTRMVISQRSRISGWTSPMTPTLPETRMWPAASQRTERGLLIVPHPVRISNDHVVRPRCEEHYYRRGWPTRERSSYSMAETSIQYEERCISLTQRRTNYGRM